jgi:hypothetical protein
MTTLQQALDALVSTYGSLDVIAQSASVDADEVATALAAADADSAEGVALRALAKYNPVVTPVVTPIDTPVIEDAISQA